MNNRIILQVPMSKPLKEQAELVAADYGFSSLQEVIRVILNKFAMRTLNISITEAEEITHLSPANEKYYKKSINDIKHGRNITKTNNIDELFQLLNK